jgi:biopolymer transport protein ExbD
MKRRKDEFEGGVNLTIIVTPMLDMAFQLMAFFIMTYHPSALEGHYKINQVLPPEKKPGLVGPKMEKEDLLPTTDIEPKLVDVILVTIKATERGQIPGRSDGEIYRILLKKPQTPAPEMIADADRGDDNAQCLKNLAVELQKLREAGTATSDIKLEPDPELKHEFTMNVMGVCRREGFRRISFVEPTVKK